MPRVLPSPACVKSVTRSLTMLTRGSINPCIKAALGLFARMAQAVHPPLGRQALIRGGFYANLFPLPEEEVPYGNPLLLLRYYCTVVCEACKTSCLVYNKAHKNVPTRTTFCRVLQYHFHSLAKSLRLRRGLHVIMRRPTRIIL